MKNETLTVQGMSCGHCVNAIKSALKEINVDANVDLDSKSVAVTYDDSKVSIEKIKEAIDDQGYDVE